MKNQTIKRRRGDTAPVVCYVLDDDGQPKDITGATFKLTVDPSSAPGDALNNVFQAVGTIVDAVGGIVSFPIPGTSSVGAYYYDVEMTDATSAIETVAAGRYIIAQDITK